MIEIAELLSAPDIAGVAALVAETKSPSVLGYHAPAYQAGMETVIGDRSRHVIARNAGGTITGWMPFREKSAAPGIAMNALPFFGPNGLTLAKDAITATALLEAYGAEAARPKVISAVLYTPFLGETDAAGFGASEGIEKFTQYLDLAGFAAWPKKRRGDLKRAEAAGFSLRPARAGDAAGLHRLHVENCLEVGIPQKPEAFFDLTVRLSLSDESDPALFGRPPLWLIAERQGRMAAAALVMRGPLTMSYCVPIAEPDQRADQPIAFLIDATVRRHIAADGRYFNFESSPAWGDAVFKYKERWGALTAPYRIAILFPNGAAKTEALDPAACRASYPYYFVRPFGSVGGSLPKESGS